MPAPDEPASSCHDEDPEPPLGRRSRWDRRTRTACLVLAVALLTGIGEAVGQHLIDRTETVVAKLAD